MHKHCRSLLLASLALSCGLLASCLSSGPEKPLGAMADAMEKNDSATFLAQIDMPRFAANEARNMTNENEALNMLDSLGQDLGLGGMGRSPGSDLQHQLQIGSGDRRRAGNGHFSLGADHCHGTPCPQAQFFCFYLLFGPQALRRRPQVGRQQRRRLQIAGRRVVLRHGTVTSFFRV